MIKAKGINDIDAVIATTGDTSAMLIFFSLCISSIEEVNTWTLAFTTFFQSKPCNKFDLCDIEWITYLVKSDMRL